MSRDDTILSTAFNKGTCMNWNIYIHKYWIFEEKITPSRAFLNTTQFCYAIGSVSF